MEDDFSKQYEVYKPELDADGNIYIPALEAALNSTEYNLAALKNKKENKTSPMRGFTKRKFVVEEDNWGATKEQRISVGLAADSGRDPFRAIAGKYWTTAPSTDPSAASHLTYFNKGNDAKKEDGIPFSIHLYGPMYDPSPSGANNPFFEVHQVVALFPDKSQFMGESPNLPEGAGEFYMASKWKSLILGGSVAGDDTSLGLFGSNQFVDYDYLAFSVPLPSSKEEQDNLITSGQIHAHVKPEYNFYIQQYERALVDPSLSTLSERSLPNLYAVMMEKLNKKSNPYFHNHLSLGDTLAPSKVSSLAATDGIPKAGPKFDVKKHSRQYFGTWSRHIHDALEGQATPSVLSTGNKFKNIIIPSKNIPLLKEIASKKEMFPMFVDIEMSTDKTSEFADLLRSTHLLDTFTMEVAKTVATGQGFEEKIFTEVSETQSVIINDDDTTSIKRTTSTEAGSRRIWDVTNLLQKIALVDFKNGGSSTEGDTAEFNQLAMEQMIVLDDSTIEQLHLVEPQNKFFKSLMGVVFMGKLKQIIKKRFRTFDDMMVGKSNYSETTLYRIEKRKLDGNGNPIGEIIQNYWIPNLSDQDVINIVDTQIKYNNHYVYTIYAYQMAVETSYNYSGAGATNDIAAFVVNQIPKIVLVEQKVFEDKHLIMDSPPCAPDMQIVPYFGDDRRLLINLNGSVDDYMMQPILIDADDVARISEVRTAQKVLPPLPIRYNSDDSIGDGGFFEIFRISYHPKSWSDFANSTVDRVAINATSGHTLKASSASTITYLFPNQKYYYICRVVDAHDHVSNPTAIYEVELVNDKGKIFLNKRVVDFIPREPKSASKPMRRLVEIKAALGQTFADLYDEAETAFDVKNIKLGDDVSPWGKKFKFRFISKKTGKKIDFNMTFKTKIEKGILEE